MTRVKICGCMKVADAVAAAEAGADFIGILFARKSRRRVDPQEAALIARAVGTPLRELDQDDPPPLRPTRQNSATEWFEHGAHALERILSRKRPLVVGVFEDQTIDEVNEIADESGIDLIQLAGDEPWDNFMLANRPVINAIHDAAGVDLNTHPADGPIALMIDASRGTGTEADVAAAADLAAKVPLWLAGGLSPANVRDAIAAVHPWLADVSTGVETDGAKDPEKIRAFVEAVRSVP